MTPPPRSSLAVLLVAAGCASHRAPPAPPVARPGNDTIVVQLASPPCPPPPRCPAPPDPRSLKVPPRADTSLWIALDSLAETDYLAGGGILGAWVQRLRDTVPLWFRSPDARLLPASTQKVFTVSAALAELGPNFRWRTGAWMTGSVQDSVLNGSIVLEGGGDPTLGMPDGTGLSGIASAVQRSGIRRVHGNLVALDTLVGRGLEAWPPGWTVGSSRDGYGAPVLGLNWSQNRVGDRSLPEPRPQALKALRKALLAKGIQVLGSDTTVKVRGDSIGPRRNWVRLGGVQSGELEPIARICLRESVNPFAEAMMIALGAGRRGPPREGGRRHLQEWLAGRGLDASRMVVDDGSGLSRYDLATARLMAQHLDRDARGPEPRLLSLLPRGGEGTLRRRVSRFPDPSVLVAKTGTLDGVANLAGYLVRPGRDTLAFAFLCNGFAGSPRPVRLFQDRMLALLAGLPLRAIHVSDTADSSLVRADSSKTVPAAVANKSSFLQVGGLPPAVPPVKTDSVMVPPASSASAAPPPPDSSRVAPPPAAPADSTSRSDSIPSGREDPVRR